MFRKSRSEIMFFMIKFFMTSAENASFQYWSLKEDFPPKGEGIMVNNRYVIPGA